MVHRCARMGQERSGLSYGVARSGWQGRPARQTMACARNRTTANTAGAILEWSLSLEYTRTRYPHRAWLRLGRVFPVHQGDRRGDSADNACRRSPDAGRAAAAGGYRLQAAGRSSTPARSCRRRWSLLSSRPLFRSSSSRPASSTSIAASRPSSTRRCRSGPRSSPPFSCRTSAWDAAPSGDLRSVSAACSS